jgi:hypothetical protein
MRRRKRPVVVSECGTPDSNEFVTVPTSYMTDPHTVTIRIGDSGIASGYLTAVGATFAQGVLLEVGHNFFIVTFSIPPKFPSPPRERVTVRVNSCWSTVALYVSPLV